MVEEPPQALVRPYASGHPVGEKRMGLAKQNHHSHYCQDLLVEVSREEVDPDAVPAQQQQRV